MKKPNIVVVGSSNTDMIIKLERIPQLGETVLGGEFLTAAGGKGANQAVAAARAGGQVGLIACLGRDTLGDRAMAGFLEEGIHVNYVSRDRQVASGAALIFVARNGENCIAVASGANSRLSPAHIKKARSIFARAKILLMQLETPLDAVEAAARLAASNEAQIILNPAPARALPDRLLRAVSILTPNESEAEGLTGIKMKGLVTAEKAAHALRRRGVQTVVLTLGAQGALIVHPRGTQLIAGFKSKGRPHDRRRRRFQRRARGGTHRRQVLKRSRPLRQRRRGHLRHLPGCTAVSTHASGDRAIP